MMKLHTIPFALLSLSLLTTGCGTSKYGLGPDLCDPNVSPLGPDTYFARGNCSGANYSISAASFFCRQQGKVSLVRSITGNDIVFRCLAANDPENRRPDYRKDPNVIIQDNRPP